MAKALLFRAWRPHEGARLTFELFARDVLGRICSLGSPLTSGRARDRFLGVVLVAFFLDTKLFLDCQQPSHCSAEVSS